MRQVPTFALTSWLAALTSTIALVAGIYLTCPGCIDGSRANSRCQWTGDPRLELDVHDRAHWRHLVADAQLAEEVAVRSGDAEYPRRYWAGAGDLHARNAQAQVACLARLNAHIEDLHGVTSRDRAAANQQRNLLFDSLVIVSFMPFYLYGSRRIGERFRAVLRAESASIRLPAIAVASVVSSGVGLVAFRLWWTLMEGMRVGNPDGHFGFRAAAEHYWSSTYVAAWLTAGAIRFWFVAFLSSQKTDSVSVDDGTAAGPQPSREL